jgi:uncharacterized protein (DUF983 family)
VLSATSVNQNCSCATEISPHIPGDFAAVLTTTLICFRTSGVYLVVYMSCGYVYADLDVVLQNPYDWLWNVDKVKRCFVLDSL